MVVNERWQLCTHCPTPCQSCRTDGVGAFCASTPCPCACHGRMFAPDPVKPRHYKDLDPEPIRVISSWKLNFNLGNVLKYVARADLKGQPLVDLKKAAEYLADEIAHREGGAK
jgi:hypothetical protein